MAKQKELFTKAMVKDLEALFRNCDERVAKAAFGKLVDNADKIKLLVEMKKKQKPMPNTPPLQ